MTEEVVRLTGVGRRYGPRGRGVWALRDVSLGVPAGSFVAVMGATGSGKSTLLHPTSPSPSGCTSRRSVEKHVTAIFTKLDLPPASTDHRRVLAVLRYLDAQQRR